MKIRYAKDQLGNLISFITSIETIITSSEFSGKSLKYVLLELKAQLNELNTTFSSDISSLNSRIEAMIGGAPELLDTLDELSQALNDNPNAINEILNVIAEIKASLQNKVDKIDGKQLSSNDYTNEDLNFINKLKLMDLDSMSTKISSLETSKANQTDLDSANTKLNELEKELDSLSIPEGVKVNNTLTSDAVEEALSANQGRILNNTKLNVQQGIDYANQFMKVGEDGLLKPSTIDYSDILNRITKLSELADDANHRFITDEEKAIWNQGVSASIKIKGTRENPIILKNLAINCLYLISGFFKFQEFDTEIRHVTHYGETSDTTKQGTSTALMYLYNTQPSRDGYDILFWNVEFSSKNITPYADSLVWCGINFSTTANQSSFYKSRSIGSNHFMTYYGSSSSIDNTTMGLSVGNSKIYVPTGPYNPATKKFVEDTISNNSPILSLENITDIEDGAYANKLATHNNFEDKSVYYFKKIKDNEFSNIVLNTYYPEIWLGEDIPSIISSFTSIKVYLANEDETKTKYIYLYLSGSSIYSSSNSTHYYYRSETGWSIRVLNPATLSNYDPNTMNTYTKIKIETVDSLLQPYLTYISSPAKASPIELALKEDLKNVNGFTTLTGTEDNPIALYDLEDGVYYLNGYYRYGTSDWMTGQVHDYNDGQSVYMLVNTIDSTSKQLTLHAEFNGMANMYARPYLITIWNVYNNGAVSGGMSVYNLNNLDNIPTRTSQLTNDGDGTGKYATTEEFNQAFTDRWASLTSSLLWKSDLPYLNGDTTRISGSDTLYVPVVPGTAGQILTSSGTGAPTWENAPEGISVIDSLTNESTTSALSANQGKILKEEVDKKATIENYSILQHRSNYNALAWVPVLDTTSTESLGVEEKEYLKTYNLNPIDSSGGYERYTLKLHRISKTGSYNDLLDKPTIPSIEGLASETFVTTKIAELINSAPTTLDTLGELAIAVQENDDLITALNSAIGNKADASHNHDSVYSKLGHSHSYSELTGLPTIPTKTSQLTNDSSYITTSNIKAGTGISVSASGDNVTISSINSGITGTRLYYNASGYTVQSESIALDANYSTSVGMVFGGPATGYDSYLIITNIGTFKIKQSQGYGSTYSNYYYYENYFSSMSIYGYAEGAVSGTFYICYVYYDDEEGDDWIYDHSRLMFNGTPKSLKVYEVIGLKGI